MKKKAEMSGGGKFLTFIIILFFIAIVVLVKYHDKFDFMQKIDIPSFKDKVTSQVVEARSYVLPPSENDWCKIQVMRVDDNIEEPISDEIIGWDTIDNCCVRKIKGYNCALKSVSVMKYCYTANLGGEIKYISINNYYANVSAYQQYKEDYEKEYIENKPCDITKYPEILWEE